MNSSRATGKNPETNGESGSAGMDAGRVFRLGPVMVCVLFAVGEGRIVGEGAGSVLSSAPLRDTKGVGIERVGLEGAPVCIVVYQIPGRIYPAPVHATAS